MGFLDGDCCGGEGHGERGKRGGGILWERVWGGEGEGEVGRESEWWLRLRGKGGDVNVFLLFWVSFWVSSWGDLYKYNLFQKLSKTGGGIIANTNMRSKPKAQIQNHAIVIL